MTDTIKVLDKGYVRLVDSMGSDLSVVNAARVSYDKEVQEFSGSDERLLKFLLEHGHTSPLRHASISYEAYAPLMVARQWFKYSIASSHIDDQNGWNESCLPGHQVVNGMDCDYTVDWLLENGFEGLQIKSVRDGSIVPNEIKHIWHTGYHKVYRVTDELGNSVELTSTHRVLTIDDWKPVAELNVGDTIYHNGMPSYTSREWLVEQASRGLDYKRIAEVAGCSDRTVYDWFKRLDIGRPSDYHLWRDREWLEGHYVETGMSQEECSEIAGCSVATIRKWIQKFGLQQDQVQRLKNHNREHEVYGKGISGTPEMVSRGLKAKETRLGNGGYEVPHGKEHHSYNEGSTLRSTMHYRARRVAQDQGWTTCRWCDSPYDEVHHRNANWMDNSAGNLEPVCYAHHNMMTKRVPTVYGSAKVVSIEYVGKEDVYDIEMVHESNFFAGNIVVHNSRRYVTEEPTFYIPDEGEWRSAPENSKQGSGEPIPTAIGHQMMQTLMQYVDDGIEYYDRAMASGVCAEQARLFLPAYGMYVRWRWMASLQSVMHFLQQRLASDAQSEIVAYAKAVRDLTEPLFPVTFEHTFKDN